MKRVPIGDTTRIQPGQSQETPSSKALADTHAGSDSGEVEANLLRLNGEFGLPYIPDLVARKLSGAEKSTLPDVDLHFHEREIERLTRELEAARDSSTLPEAATPKPALNDLLVRLRLAPVR